MMIFESNPSEMTALCGWTIQWWQ